VSDPKFRRYEGHWDWVVSSRRYTYLWKGAVVPEITMMGEAVAHEAKLALFDVLLDGVKRFFFRDLSSSHSISFHCPR